MSADAAPAPLRSRQPWPLLVGAGLVALGLLLQSPRVLAADPLAHLILAGTAAVLLLHRLREPAAPGSPALGVALALLAALAAFAAPVAGAIRPPLLHAALALLLLSGVAAGFGARMAGRVAAPLLVLFVLVPMLPLFEAALSYPMRRLSALLAAAVLSLGPGTVTLTGTELAWGELRVSVTSACSGLTLLQNLIWVAWWTVLLRHTGVLQRGLHMLPAVPAVVIANTLRVIALAVAAAWQGEQVLLGTAHVIIGWAAVALAAGLFLAMEQVFPATAGAGVDGG